jgi:hypothetical protein
MRQGRTEEYHEPIAKELVDRALVTVHFPQGQIKETIQQRVHFIRTETLG